MPHPRKDEPARDAEGRPPIEGAESSIAIPESGLGPAPGADRGDKAPDKHEAESHVFPEQGG